MRRRKGRSPPDAPQPAEAAFTQERFPPSLALRSPPDTALQACACLSRHIPLSVPAGYGASGLHFGTERPTSVPKGGNGVLKILLGSVTEGNGVVKGFSVNGASGGHARCRACCTLFSRLYPLVLGFPTTFWLQMLSTYLICCSLLSFLSSALQQVR